MRVVLAAAAACLWIAAPAGAVPLDAGGALPPSRTPAPEPPDPDCSESYADESPRGGPLLRLESGRGPPEMRAADRPFPW